VGQAYKVDGVEYADQQNFTWIVGSTHEISVSESQGSADTRYMFSSWSDGGAGSHFITAPADSSLYTATFIAQVKLTTAVSPANCGFVEVNPTSPDGYYDVGSVVRLSTTTEGRYAFSAWGGDLSGTENPQRVLISAPLEVIASCRSVGFRPPRLAGSSTKPLRTWKSPSLSTKRSISAR
jgi:hypothetical protein